MKTPLVHIGTIGKPHGVRGLVHLHSCIENPKDLETYGELVDDHSERWTICWQSEKVAALYDSQKKRMDNRTAVEKLTNRKLFVPKSLLPEPDEDEFYYSDLVGLQAKIKHDDQTEELFGTVYLVHDYGAGVSLEIKRGEGENAIIPFTKLCFPHIDIKSGWLEVCPPNEVEVRPSDVEDQS
ncbi:MULTISPECIES: ribosome maturation factor RimM [Commensalibacter]|uniref:Ribosome maturation factor RimM n=2 Tax=Commensalibacter TaxID=1079922 RepID=W7E0R6_9PROT|nr:MULTISPECIES: ribosome maturation factor RimM [Commensalibacter]EUK18599.1 ribosome maturation factor RimM [Commensalibacter papalotli (ex Servin-Garciduenas et al. 2014)]CAI3930949.1 Ribosomal 30S subunit maturation factor RimM [Commensalibacter papalotli (ex Botero et al. 2024)]CAI3944723.1 Ribosomal 30S subunit maturation factor RimM [Commensalibacter papalotli (ex Botero et al. 2024)]